MSRWLVIPLALVALLVAAACVRFAMLGASSRSGGAPGLASGRLARCPAKPNCVCSEFAEDTAHYVAPLDYAGAPREAAWTGLLEAIEAAGGEIAVADDEYVAATFSSALFGFVDDLECRLDAAQQRIQIRSASRVGYSDLGVNRKRVAEITRSFEQKLGRVEVD